MEYIVRVRHDSGKLADKVDEFNTDSVVADDLDELHEKATKAYVDAVTKYSSGHTVSIFRDGVAVHEALGTGSTVLSEDSEDAPEGVKFGVAPVAKKK